MIIDGIPKERYEELLAIWGSERSIPVVHEIDLFPCFLCKHTHSLRYIYSIDMKENQSPFEEFAVQFCYDCDCSLILPMRKIYLEYNKFNGYI